MKKQRWRRKKGLCYHCKKPVNKKDSYGYFATKIFHYSCGFKNQQPTVGIKKER